MVDGIPSSLKTRCDWCAGAFHCFSSILALELVRKLYQETKGHMLALKIGTRQDLLAIWTNRPDLSYKLLRPIIQTGQTGQDSFVKLSIGLHHCVDLVEMIEMHIQIVQFGVWMRELCLPEDLHPGLTGQTGPGAVRPVRKVQSELGVVF